MHPVTSRIIGVPARSSAIVRSAPAQLNYSTYSESSLLASAYIPTAEHGRPCPRLSSSLLLCLTPTVPPCKVALIRYRHTHACLFRYTGATKAYLVPQKRCHSRVRDCFDFWKKSIHTHNKTTHNPHQPSGPRTERYRDCLVGSNYSVVGCRAGSGSSRIESRRLRSIHKLQARSPRLEPQMLQESIRILPRIHYVFPPSGLPPSSRPSFQTSFT